MNRPALLDQLKDLQQQAEEANFIIGDQMEIIARFEKAGDDISEANRLLANYRVMQEVRFTKIDQLLDQLDATKDTVVAAASP